MIYRVAHHTIYDYSDTVSLSHHVLRLRPRATARQRVVECELQVTPVPVTSAHYTDHFGNPIVFVSIEAGHQKLVVAATSVVEVFDSPVIEPAKTLPWDSLCDLGLTAPQSGGLDAVEFIYDSPLIKTEPEYAAYAKPSFVAGRPLLEAAEELTERIFEDFKFDPTATTVATPLHDVFKHRRGVCQDFAHVQIACLRSLGLPARYVSGYLETEPPPGKPRVIGADASHAWVSVFCPGSGWIDLDPTNNVLPSTRHITVGWGRDYSDISPVRGVILGGGKHELSVSVDVARAL